MERRDDFGTNNFWIRHDGHRAPVVSDQTFLALDVAPAAVFAWTVNSSESSTFPSTQSITTFHRFTFGLLHVKQ